MEYDTVYKTRKETLNNKLPLLTIKLLKNKMEIISPVITKKTTSTYVIKIERVER
jgi:hypothetical protein